MGYRLPQRGLVLFLASLAGPVFAADFSDLIRTPEGIQRTLESCDGRPAFETALANWLETVEPSSPEQRRAVRETSLRLLEDTTDRQLVLGLSDGLLRHAIEDLRRDRKMVPADLADALFAGIKKAIGKTRSKVEMIAIAAHGLAADGTVADERHAAFVERFLDLAEPRVAHNVTPSQRTPVETPQADKGLVSRR